MVSNSSALSGLIYRCFDLPWVSPTVIHVNPFGEVQRFSNFHAMEFRTSLLKTSGRTSCATAAKAGGNRINNGSFWTPFTIILILMLLGICVSVQGQEKPPRPIRVTTYQDLSFGSIILGMSGGTVSIDPTGIRSKIGDLILPPMGSQGNEAIFEIKAPPGTLITVQFGPATLSNGGHSMNLVLGPTFPVSPFITTVQQNQSNLIHVGGTLTVGNGGQNPSGNYSGSFTVTFIQQ